MLPETFEQVNHVMQSPGCLDIPVCGTKFPDGTPVIISLWKPTQEELEELKNGGGIYLMIQGVGIPPLNMEVKSPFN